MQSSNPSSSSASVSTFIPSFVYPSFIDMLLDAVQQVTGFIAAIKKAPKLFECESFRIISFTSLPHTYRPRSQGLPSSNSSASAPT